MDSLPNFNIRKLDNDRILVIDLNSRERRIFNNLRAFTDFISQEFLKSEQSLANDLRNKSNGL